MKGLWKLTLLLLVLLPIAGVATLGCGGGEPESGGVGTQATEEEQQEDTGDFVDEEGLEPSGGP